MLPARITFVEAYSRRMVSALGSHDSASFGDLCHYAAPRSVFSPGLSRPLSGHPAIVMRADGTASRGLSGIVAKRRLEPRSTADGVRMNAEAIGPMRPLGQRRPAVRALIRARLRRG